MSSFFFFSSELIVNRFLIVSIVVNKIKKKLYTLLYILFSGRQMVYDIIFRSFKFIKGLLYPGSIITFG